MVLLSCFLSVLVLSSATIATVFASGRGSTQRSQDALGLSSTVVPFAKAVFKSAAQHANDACIAFNAITPTITASILTSEEAENGSNRI
jgi:hypothetical protein